MKTFCQTKRYKYILFNTFRYKINKMQILQRAVKVLQKNCITKYFRTFEKRPEYRLYPQKKD